MGTKLTELRDGCFHKAMDDEPMFVLLARDTSGPLVIRIWADVREAEIRQGVRPATDMTQVIDARATADKMEQWRSDNDGAWRTGLFYARPIGLDDLPAPHRCDIPPLCCTREKDHSGPCAALLDDLPENGLS